MVPTSKSPDVGAEKLAKFGFSIAIYPSAGMGPVCAALDGAYAHLKAKGTMAGCAVPAYSMKELHELVGFQDVWDFEKRHVEVK